MNSEQLIDQLRIAHTHHVLAPVFGIVAPASLHTSLIERVRQLLAVDLFDIHILTAEAEERNIRVKNARRWQRELVTSARGERKIGFIVAADQLNLSSANTLLKILEEPPVSTYLVLLLTRDNLLPTVRSRVQLFSISVEEEGVLPIMPDTVSAIIKMASLWSADSKLKEHLQLLLTQLRVGLKKGTVSPTYVQSVLSIYTEDSQGINQRLQAEKILLSYEI